MKTPNKKVSFSVDPGCSVSVGYLDTSDLTWTNHNLTRHTVSRNKADDICDFLMMEISSVSTLCPKVRKCLKEAGLTNVWQIVIIYDCLPRVVNCIGKKAMQKLSRLFLDNGLVNSYQTALRHRMFNSVYGLSFSILRPKDKLGLVIHPQDVSVFLRCEIPRILQDVKIRD
jgi:hypothetical protein